MKRMVRQTLYLVASVVTALGLAVVPVSAQRGSVTTDHLAPVDDTSAASSNDQGADTQAATTDTETSDTSGSQSGKLRQEARQLLQTKREAVKAHTVAQRQKACEQRQADITRRTDSFGAAAQRHLDTFNKIFTRVQAFQASKQLSASNYDELVAAATAKQTAAQTATDALKALNVQIDCTQADPASTVATVKSATADARTALQSYRSALKDLIVALTAAADAQKTTSSTGGAE